MNYKLITTAAGKYWVKQVWDEEKGRVVETPLAIGEKIVLDPEEFINDSSVFLFKGSESVPATHENGDHYTLEELVAEISQELSGVEFKPSAFYNKGGDGIQLYWENVETVSRWHPGFDIHTDVSTGKVVGVNIWGLKNILMKAYANPDKPDKYIELPALDPKA